MLGEYSQVAPATGTAISNLPELKAMVTAVSSDPSGEYYLTAHIDLTGETWTPIASSATPFTGKLHGNGYAIYNLTIDAETATPQGLFASVSGATIDNLSIGVANIKGEAAVGALAGFATNNATLSNIAVAPMAADAKIEALSKALLIDGLGGSHVGGLLGVQASSGSLTGYSQVTVKGVSIVDGLVGFFTTTGSISGYATGDVSGQVNIDGLVGSRSGTVTGYATGDVNFNSRNPNVGIGGLVGATNGGTITGYWDKQSTSQDASIGGATAVGIGKTQNIVFTAGTGYTDSGNSDSAIFDNTDLVAIFDTENGADKTWPKLKSDSFDFPQPTVTVSASDDNIIEVTY